MKEDISKTNRQNKGIDIWRNFKGIGTLVYPPGFGKTNVAILVIRRVLLRTTKVKIQIITPNEIVFNRWIEELNNSNLNNNNIRVKTINTVLNDGEHEDYYLTIYDEIHKYCKSTNRRNMLLNMYFTTKFKLGLTGTIPNNADDYNFLMNTCPIVDTITDKEAIVNNWISNYIEYNLGLTLNPKDTVLYEYYSTFIKDTMALFKNNYDLMQLCYIGNPKLGVSGSFYREQVATENGWRKDLDLSIEHYAEINKYYNPNNIYERVKEYKVIERNRNEFINEHIDKLNICIDLVKYLYPCKAISFSQSTTFADKLADMLRKSDVNAISYHSQLKSIPLINPDTNQYYTYKSGVKKGELKLFGLVVLKKLAIEKFSSGELNVMSTAKSMDEGFNDESIDVVIITSGSCDSIQQDQRTGRGKRIDILNKGKIVTIVNIYFKNTRDEQKLEARQKNNTYPIRYISSIEEIEIR